MMPTTEARAERITNLRRMVEDGRQREAGMRLAVGAAAGGDREIRIVIEGVEFAPMISGKEALLALIPAHRRAELLLQQRESLLEDAFQCGTEGNRER